MAVVNIGGTRYGYIDKNGKETIELKYDGAWDFSNGLARIRKGVKCGYVNKDGKEVIAPKYDGVGKFINGFARVRNGYEYFFIDKNGNEIKEPEGISIEGISENMIILKIKNKPFLFSLEEFVKLYQNE